MAQTHLGGQKAVEAALRGGADIVRNDHPSDTELDPDEMAVYVLEDEDPPRTIYKKEQNEPAKAVGGSGGGGEWTVNDQGNLTPTDGEPIEIDELNNADIQNAAADTVPTAQGDGTLAMAAAGGDPSFSSLTDISGSVSYGTQQTNDTGNPILLFARINGYEDIGATNSSKQYHIRWNVNIDGTTVMQIIRNELKLFTDGSGTTVAYELPLTVPVPAGSTYQFDNFGVHEIPNNQLNDIRRVEVQ